MGSWVKVHSDPVVSGKRSSIFQIALLLLVLNIGKHGFVNLIGELGEGVGAVAGLLFLDVDLSEIVEFGGKTQDRVDAKHVAVQFGAVATPIARSHPHAVEK